MFPAYGQLPPTDINPILRSFYLTIFNFYTGHYIYIYIYIYILNIWQIGENVKFQMSATIMKGYG
jgi:hypothetical protein